MNTPPRIRARCGQYTEPPEWKDKWAYEVSLWSFDGEELIGPPFGPFGPYETEKECVMHMREACKVACESIEAHHGGKSSGKFIDMKNGGVLRSWEEN